MIRKAKAKAAAIATVGVDMARTPSIWLTSTSVAPLCSASGSRVPKLRLP
jgi:hypothetical protein